VPIIAEFLLLADCESASPQRRLTEFGLALAVIKGALLSIVFNQFAPSFRGWLPTPLPTSHPSSLLLCELHHREFLRLRDSFHYSLNAR
jgi:hypothetical protein